MDKYKSVTGDLSGIGSEKGDILPKPQGQKQLGDGQVLKVSRLALDTTR